MSGSDSDSGKRVRQHVWKVFAQLKALKDRQRVQHTPGPTGSMVRDVEVEGEEDTPGGVGDVKPPS